MPPDLPDPRPRRLTRFSWENPPSRSRPSARSTRQLTTPRPSEIYVGTAHMNLASDCRRTTNVTEEAKSGQVFEPPRKPKENPNLPMAHPSGAEAHTRPRPLDVSRERPVEVRLAALTGKGYEFTGNQ